MSYRKDDDDNSVFPTRSPFSIGSANERQMLDSVGGADGFRTKIRVSADGETTTLLRTRNGWPTFTTISNKKPVPVDAGLYTSFFFGCPTSTSHAGGYNPPHAPPYDGAYSVWSDYHTYTAPPSAAPGATPEFTPTYTVPESRGSTTWFGAIEQGDGDNKTPLVVSWHWSDVRGGKYTRYPKASPYDSIDGQQYFEWTSLPNHNQTVSFASSFGRSPRVYIGANLHVDVSQVVDSAALRMTPLGYSLYVVSENRLYTSAGWEAVFDVLPGGGISVKSSISPATESSLSVLTLVGTIPLPSTVSAWKIRQIPLFNRQCTKVTFIADTTVSSVARASVIEVDVDTLVSSVAFTAADYIVEGIGTHSDISTLPYTENLSVGPGRRTVVPLASDYDASTGALVWLTGEVTRTVGARSTYQSANNSTGSPAPPTWTLTADANAWWEEDADSIVAKLSHSAAGVLHTETFTGTAHTSSVSSISGSTERWFSGGGYISGAHTKTVASSWTAGTFQLSTQGWMLLGVDLRHKCVVANIDHGAVSRPAGASSGPYTQTDFSEYKKVIVAFGAVVRVIQGGVFPPGSTPVAGNPDDTTSHDMPIWLTAPSDPYPLPGATGAESLDPGVPSTIPPSYVYESGGYSAMPFCRVAVDPLGRVAYFGACDTPSYHSPIKYEGFVFRTGGANTEHQLPVSKYAPGSYSTIVGAVFFPEQP